MNFEKFNAAVAKQFARMSKHQLMVVQTRDNNELFEAYIAAFPEGSNPLYKTRTEHDCNCCKAFIRKMGAVVAIIDGKVESIWDIDVPEEPNYQIVADVLAGMVKGRKIVDYFLHYEPRVGTAKNFELFEGKSIQHTHFNVTLPTDVVVNKDAIASIIGKRKTAAGVLQRALDAYTVEGLDTVLELVDSDQLYGGKEDRFTLVEVRKLLVEYSKLSGVQREAYALMKTPTIGAAQASVYGTLIGDLILASSIGDSEDFEKAVNDYEFRKAGPNYKRPTSLVTQKQVDEARKYLLEMGYASAMERRHANLSDISVCDTIFVNSSTAVKMDAADDFLADIAGKVVSNPKKFDRLETISIGDFIEKIVPTASGIEVYFANKNESNLVSLITASDATAKNIFQWDNPFSWTYIGDLADKSILKERVKNAGGSIVGDLCCRLGWGNWTDLDFYMREPGSNVIYYGSRGMRHRSGGKLDVDANCGGSDGGSNTPVENIFYESISTMPDGEYNLEVNVYRQNNNGTNGKDRTYTVEVDMLGEHFTYTGEFSPNMVRRVATFIKKNGTLTLKKGSLINSVSATKKVWGLDTEQFIKCNAMMFSPNFWNSEIGRQHVFFMLDGCVNDESARGFYNEYLSGDLHQHRKVMEIVGGKRRADVTENQLSGLGFSLTSRQEVVVRVTGKTERMFKVTF